MLLWQLFGAHQKSTLGIPRVVIVLVMFYKHVPFSMCPKQDPQRHFKVQSGCGCSIVRVGVRHVSVARVLGTSDWAKMSRAYNRDAKRSLRVHHWSLIVRPKIWLRRVSRSINNYVFPGSNPTSQPYDGLAGHGRA